MKKHYLLYLLIAVSSLQLFSSCVLPAWVDGSLHGANKQYKGDSYEKKYVDKFNFGINLSAMLSAGAMGFTPEKEQKKTSFIYSNPEDIYTSIYAGGSNQANSASAPAAGEENTKGKIDLFTGLELVMKNSKDQDVKINATYLEVPVYAVYVQPLKSGGKIFGGLGPYFAYGLGGKTKGGGFSEKTFDKEFGLKRFDAGLALTAGYMFHSGVYARLGYDYGLADIDRIDVDHTKNRSFSLNVGFPISNLIKKK